MTAEYLPATGAARQNLVLLHGWGSGREVWRSLLPQLRPWANVTLLDLPGCAPGLPAGELEQVLRQVLVHSPEQAVYVGWSLGGQLALELARCRPERVLAVVTLGSNPRFVAEHDWPGMAAEDFSAFRAGIAAQAPATLRRFDSLQVSGAERPRPLLRRLPGLRAAAADSNLAAGLDWLAALDQRQWLSDLLQPQLHLLGEEDALVPVSLAPVLQKLVGEGSVAVLPGACHLLPLERPTDIATRLQDFLQAAGLWPAVVAPAAELAKEDVAASFSRAAQTYDSVAQLQRDVGGRLLADLNEEKGVPIRVLDLGCGTGFFYPQLRRRYPAMEYIGLDLAAGMVDYAREHHGTADHWLVGDAESLPLATGSVDLVFSSLAVQWCHRPQLLFAELARVLRSGGRCVFTTLGPGTLRELRAAWAAVDDHQHVNHFLPAEVLAGAASEIPGLRLSLRSEQFQMHYQRVRELLDELKTLGAHNVNRERPAGLTGRRSLQGMLQAYEEWRREGLLPATYDVLYGELERA